MKFVRLSKNRTHFNSASKERFRKGRKFLRIKIAII